MDNRAFQGELEKLAIGFPFTWPNFLAFARQLENAGFNRPQVLALLKLAKKDAFSLARVSMLPYLPGILRTTFTEQQCNEIHARFELLATADKK